MKLSLRHCLRMQHVRRLELQKKAPLTASQFAQNLRRAQHAYVFMALGQFPELSVAARKLFSNHMSDLLQYTASDLDAQQELMLSISTFCERHWPVDWIEKCKVVESIVFTADRFRFVM